MGCACPSTPSPTAASATRATRVPSATSLPSRLTPVTTGPVSMATAASPQGANPPASATADTPEPSVTKVGAGEVGAQGEQPHTGTTRLSIAVPQSPSVMGSRCGTTTRCSGAMPSARRHGRWPGWNAGGPAAALELAAALGCGSGAGNTPSNAATAQPSWRRWRSPASVAAASACERPLALESLGAGGERPRSQGLCFALQLWCYCLGVSELHLHRGSLAEGRAVASRGLGKKTNKQKTRNKANV